MNLLCKFLTVVGFFMLGVGLFVLVCVAVALACL